MKVTMKDIAKEAGVSVATVSHVINGTKNITEPKRSKVLEIIEKYHYVPNSTAKNLRTQSTKTAAMVVSSFTDSFVNGMIYGVEQKAREMGYSLLLVNTNEDEEYEKKSINLLYSKMVDGIILSPTSNDINYLNDFTESMPIVLVNRYNPVVKNAPRVTGDNFRVGYDATSHLIQHGHRNIGVIYAVPNVSTTEGRLAGYRQALEENGIMYDEEHLELGYATVEGGAKAAETLLKKEKDITALFIQNDLMTIGVISKLKELGLKIPENIALIGFGDSPSAAITAPPITNMVLPPQQIGAKAFESLSKLINGETHVENIELPASMVVRKSCGCE
ncbi:MULTISPECIES: LacI family DNA-binding transcriptional regulator [Salinicoccus]|uniref:LacI family transcriptional regulator n=1 Tax=Salinicoccus roseus TaxID=45670 RepID=A0A265E7E3_9STAP|nr:MULTISPECIES: LacI family DNA-binding transcriptional regulator [Salinicoccus]OZT77517.1 LacI family transcriptional regulator [Salinicoccus roseus]